MASSHKLKDPNGDPNLSSQDKSINVRLPNQGIDSNSNETIPSDYVDQIVKHYEEAGDSYIKAIDKITSFKPEIKYDFDDIILIPKAQTNIRSRREVNPYYKNELTKNMVDRLPLFTAPMDSVVDLKSMRYFKDAKINVVLPRTEVYKEHAMQFNSFGLSDRLNGYSEETGLNFILLDVANGHMSLILEWCNKVKKEYPHVKIMAGNIANPKTYKIYCDSGVIDYARVGIGNGNGCLTTQQTGIGYPMASLIIECNAIKRTHKNKVKIVADGGMKKYSDIIKALALGADYVMVGSIFSKALESAAPNYWGKLKIGRGLSKIMYEAGLNIHKEFRGMSTKAAQKAMGNNVLKTSEGVIRKYKVEYELNQWSNNFEDYLRSTMSYCNANSLQNFIGQVDYSIISNNAFNRFNK
jgi:IMP dehydrogenase/GMP reductase